MAKKVVKKSKSGKSRGSADVEERRAAFNRWLAMHKTNPNSAATLADVSVSSIYNFLNGPSKSLGSSTLNKLAVAHNCSVDSILYGREETAHTNDTRVKVTYRIGARGSMFICTDNLVAIAPEGVALPGGVSAALVDGDGLLPIPDGWTVYFKEEPADPASLVGKLATVRYSGGGDRPVVRNVQRSQHDGLYTLQALDGTLTEDVKIVAAHEIVGMLKSVISEL